MSAELTSVQMPRPDPPNDGKLAFEQFLQLAAATGEPLCQAGSLREFIDLAEKYRIQQALTKCHGNRSAAARVLGIGRRTLYAKMEKLSIGRLKPSI